MQFSAGRHLVYATILYCTLLTLFSPMPLRFHGSLVAFVPTRTTSHDNTLACRGFSGLLTNMSVWKWSIRRQLFDILRDRYGAYSEDENSIIVCWNLFRKGINGDKVTITSLISVYCYVQVYLYLGSSLNEYFTPLLLKYVRHSKKGHPKSSILKWVTGRRATIAYSSLLSYWGTVSRFFG